MLASRYKLFQTVCRTREGSDVQGCTNAACAGTQRSGHPSLFGLRKKNAPRVKLGAFLYMAQREGFTQAHPCACPRRFAVQTVPDSLSNPRGFSPLPLWTP